MRRPELSPTRSLAWLYSSTAQRAAIASLTALEREIGSSLRPGLDHQVAHARLAWWREECARTAEGHATHPITQELVTLFTPSTPFAPPGATPLAGLGGFVDTAVWDLSCATFETRRELTGYCERWSAAMIVPLVWLAPLDSLALPLADPAAQAQSLGVSLREIELLLALASDARSGRLRVPLDELERAHVLPESLARPPWPPSLVELLRHRHRELRGALGATLAALAPNAQQALRGLIVWATVACAASARVAKRLPQESTARDHNGPFDGWRAWRAARRVDAAQRTTV
jgi:phytoene/squalene synthetase